MSSSDKRRGKVAIYKPNGKNTGAAAQFEIGWKAGQTDDKKNDCVFLEIAPQVGEQKFNWDKKINFKLGVADLTQMLAFWSAQLMYYREEPTPLKLYHQSANGGNKTLEMRWQRREWKGKVTHSYYMTVSQQKQKGGDVDRVGLSVDLAEVEYLKVAFKKALEVILDWNLN